MQIVIGYQEKPVRCFGSYAARYGGLKEQSMKAAQVSDTS